jgi:GTP diphosphokinase / guanosine-3',5'-bis(diphosphate) 3'-diphosphatase
MYDENNAKQQEAINQLVEKVSSYSRPEDIELLVKACKFTIDAHGSQLRQSGDPYYQHPFAVAEIIAEMNFDSASVITALLHDTVEDTIVTLDVIEKEFGNHIARLVDGVTKLTKIEYQPDHIRQAENFRKLLVAMSEDIRVLLIKLADRLHNMRTLKYIKAPEKRMRIAHETMEVYAPLAERMGIQKIKNELQDTAFAELHPEAYNSIINRLEFLRTEGKPIVDHIVNEIKSKMDENNINASVYGREKTACSIWHKMERKNIGFEQLSDIIAFRIIVANTEACYHALGVIHSSYSMIPGGFKDFVSTPKDNGYKSLHTIVIGPNRQRIEVQIRTEEMHKVAELGVAAHWVYKQGEKFSTEGTQFKWIRELLKILEQAQSEPEDFLQNTKMEMYYDQVFCFTPKGKLIQLPRLATPIDFAYAVHSDVGNTCVGAKVNGKIAPLKTQLQNGDQVDIITSKNQVPSPSWEKFVATGKARSEIRRFVRLQQRQEYINLGRAILAKSVKNEGLEFSEKELENGLEVFNRKTLEDLYASIGEGVIARHDVVNFLKQKQKPESAIKKKLSFFKFKKKPKKETISINGLIAGMAVHFGGCCHPLPGDKIVGIVHTGKGITIHTIECDTLENYTSTPERWIEVSWSSNDGEENYTGRVKAILNHSPGSLADVTTVVAKNMGNITNIKVVTRSVDFFELILDVQVKGAKHLSNIITALRSLSCVHSVERAKM